MLFFTQYLHVIACESHLKIFPLERFSNDCRKTKTLTNHKRSNQRDEPKKKSRIQDWIGFGFASNWLKNLRKTFKTNH